MEGQSPNQGLRDGTEGQGASGGRRQGGPLEVDPRVRLSPAFFALAVGPLIVPAPLSPASLCTPWPRELSCGPGSPREAPQPLQALWGLVLGQFLLILLWLTQP